MASEKWIKNRWREVVISLYFDGKIDQEQAAKSVGREVVMRAKRERSLAEDDVCWGQKA